MSTPTQGTLLGVLAVAAGAILLAAKGIFAKLLYATGLDFQTVTTVRAVIAIPGFWLLASVAGGAGGLGEATRKDFLQAAMAGIVCYSIGASANFYALTLIDASVERALLFSYPAMVVLATWLLFGQRPGRSTLLAVALTWLGIGLVVGVLDRALLSQNLVGSLWVLFCSATIAYYFLTSARLTRSMGSAQFTAVAMTAAGLALAVAYQGTHGWQNVTLTPRAWMLMVALVVFVTVLPLYLVAEGVRRIGAERGAIASTVGPPATAVMAVLLLGESISPGQLLGMGMIIGGILTLELASRRKRREQDAAAAGS